MATYKVLQDIEAEDKLLGPLTLKQFIFAAIAAICIYLCFFAVTKHVPVLIAFFLPPGLVAGFLAWPWSRDQPTEIWLLAKIRFFLKPRRRIWDQDGIQELVTITVPKKVEQHLTNDLSQVEVRSRLRALAHTIDSRGWAIKNVNVNLSTSPSYTMPDPSSDRLIDISTLPQEVPALDIVADDDMFESATAEHLGQMIGAETKQRRKQLMDQVKQAQAGPSATLPAPAGQPLWFTQPVANQPAGFTQPGDQSVIGAAQPATPLSAQEEQALLAQLHPDKDQPAALGHLKVITPPGEAPATTGTNQPPTVTAAPDPAILELAHNDDLNVATIARQAHKKRGEEPPDEVVVPLR